MPRPKRGVWVKVRMNRRSNTVPLLPRAGRTQQVPRAGGRLAVRGPIFSARRMSRLRAHFSEPVRRSGGERAGTRRVSAALCHCMRRGRAREWLSEMGARGRNSPRRRHALLSSLSRGGLRASAGRSGLKRGEPGQAGNGAAHSRRNEQLQDHRAERGCWRRQDRRVNPSPLFE